MLPLQKPLSLMKGTRNSAKMVTTTNSVRAGDQRVAIRNRQACQGRAWGDLAIPSTLPTLLGTTTSFERLQHQLGDSTLTNLTNDDTKPPQVVPVDVESIENLMGCFLWHGGNRWSQEKPENLRRRMVRVPRTVPGNRRGRCSPIGPKVAECIVVGSWVK